MTTQLLSSERLAQPRPSAFLTAVRHNLPGLAHWADDRVVAVGYFGVERIASHGGAGADNFLDLAQAHGLDRTELDLLLGLAVRHLWTLDLVAVALHRADFFDQLDDPQ